MSFISGKLGGIKLEAVNYIGYYSEHEEKMKRFEEESQEKIDREREALEVERSGIRTKREEIDNEIKAFIESNGFEKSQFLSTSTESLTKRRYSSKWMKF